ncbi:MAG: histidine phosphatase family protein [Ignavibacteriaceae bacterium]|nr:histidine phosphatase family protein [Ignavibacteriaceae bacterium]
MKKIFLIRHAKSSWKEPYLSDFDRPLNKRGKTDAPFMGELLAQKKILPDLILSSPAKRAIRTAEEIAKKINYNLSAIKADERIYEASRNELLKVLREIEKDVDVIFLVGHNPGLTFFANFLSGSEIENIPTCGIVEFNFKGSDWEDLDIDSCSLVSFEYPKKYLSKNQ